MYREAKVNMRMVAHKLQLDRPGAYLGRRKTRRALPMREISLGAVVLRLPALLHHTQL